MAISRQVQLVNMIPAIRNDAGYFAFQGTVNSDYLFKAWNVTAEWSPEFYGSAFDTALSGRVRSNFRGYRLKLSLQLDNSTEASKIRTLFNTFSAGYDRLFYTVTANGAGSGTALTLNGAPSANDYFNGLLVGNLTGGDAIATDYNGSTKVVTLSASRIWIDTQDVYIYAQPNFETIVLFDIEGTSTVYTDSDLIPCIVTGNNYGISRQSTIQQQRISIEMESVDLYQNIPDSYRIA